MLKPFILIEEKYCAVNIWSNATGTSAGHTEHHKFTSHFTSPTSFNLLPIEGKQRGTGPVSSRFGFLKERNINTYETSARNKDCPDVSVILWCTAAYMCVLSSDIWVKTATTLNVSISLTKKTFHVLFSCLPLNHP